jgi:hypothetical protein
MNKEDIDKFLEQAKASTTIQGVTVIVSVFVKEDNPILLVSPKTFLELTEGRNA